MGLRYAAHLTGAQHTRETAQGAHAQQAEQAEQEEQAEQQTSVEAHLKGRQMAQANIKKHGGAATSAPARSAFMARFEREVEELAPGLRERDPAAFWQRVAAARSAYFSGLAIKRIKQAEAKRQQQPPTPRCPLCLQGVTGLVPADLIDPDDELARARLCARHLKGWQRAQRRQVYERIARGDAPPI
jgi:hypothetical protein